MNLETRPTFAAWLVAAAGLLLLVQVRPVRAQCELSQLTGPISDYLIQFSIHLMSFVKHEGSRAGAGPDNVTQVLRTEAGSFVLKQIDHNADNGRLEAVGANASLPFVFFINGFNSVDEFGNVSDTWMFDTARMFAERQVRDGAESRRGQPGHAPARVNLVFITWSLPYYWQMSNVLSLLPAYLKTVASYERIASFVAETITNMIGFVERETRWRRTVEDETRRAAFYRQFQFYGHSLGSHIIVDAVMRAHELTGLRFGRLSGLDPANPCFVSLEHGASISRVSAAVDQLHVVHSNAGFAGLAAERADVEVVLNGGTFQPGCLWLDFGCSHARATDIFGYLDDQCSMVAYKCSSYQHFKIGACESCESNARHANESDYTVSERQRPNCVAINLPEQYQGDAAILSQLEPNPGGGGGGGGSGAVGQPVRQLADDWDETATADANRARTTLAARRQVARQTMATSGKSAAPADAARRNKDQFGDFPLARQRRDPQSAEQTRYDHYVNTNPAFASGRRTHCLQHYQARLLINYQGANVHRECPLSSFHPSRGEKIRLSLFTRRQLAQGHRGGGGAATTGSGKTSEPLGSESGRSWTNIGRMAASFRDHEAPGARGRVEDVIRDSLYTTLATFEGPPELFVGAKLDNVDLRGLARCLASPAARAPNQAGSVQFVMDVAFMSNAQQRLRRAFSSVLCGQWNATSRPADGLVLTLCRPAELAQVSQLIDQLIDQVRQETFYETWTISLLNSLFALFTEWEPLK